MLCRQLDDLVTLYLSKPFSFCSSVFGGRKRLHGNLGPFLRVNHTSVGLEQLASPALPETGDGGQRQGCVRTRGFITRHFQTSDFKGANRLQPMDSYTRRTRVALPQAVLSLRSGPVRCGWRRAGRAGPKVTAEYFITPPLRLFTPRRLSVTGFREECSEWTKADADFSP